MTYQDVDLSDYGYISCENIDGKERAVFRSNRKLKNFCYVITSLQPVLLFSDSVKRLIAGYLTYQEEKW